MSTEAYKCMYIEIMSDTEVKIHMKFNMPLSGEIDTIYFNDNMTKLFR